jgi:hypothetical protein
MACSSFFIQPKWLILHHDTHLTLSNAGCLATCSAPHRATQATTVSRKAGRSVYEILNLDLHSDFHLPVCDTMHFGWWYFHLQGQSQVTCGQIICTFGLFNSAVNF